MSDKLLPKERRPAYCEVHQHHKWCEHNGGVMGPTGWEAPTTLAEDHAPIRPVPEKVRKAWEPKPSGYTSEQAEADRQARHGQ